MKIAVINGSPRMNGNGSKFLKEIVALLHAEIDAEVETINLADKDIRMCHGCQICYDRGEALCPHHDDVEMIKNVLLECDGIILYSPTYVVNMSGMMKNFVDRLSYLCHRPAFYGKTAFVLTTTGSGGGAAALKCLRWPIVAWGLKTVGSYDIKMSLYHHNEKYQTSTNQNIKKSIVKFISQTKNVRHSYPSLIDLVGFNIKKENYLKSQSVFKYDVDYWQQKGWLDPNTDYYFPIMVSRLKKTLAMVLASVVKVVM